MPYYALQQPTTELGVHLRVVKLCLQPAGVRPQGIHLNSVLPSQLSELGIVRNAQLSQLSLVRGSRLSDSALQPLHLSCVLLRQMGEAVLCRTPAALHGWSRWQSKQLTTQADVQQGR